MGLDTTHNCWSGSYSSFNTWRTKLCEVAGYGNLDDMHGFGGHRQWPSYSEDPLVELLYHSDCDGEIPYENAAAIADRLQELLPAMKTADLKDREWSEFYSSRTEQWVKGLREAAEKKENVEFF